MMGFLPFIIDIIFIIIFASCIIDGRKKGFVKMVLSLIVTVISWLIASEYSLPVAEWINETFVHENIVESLSEKISDVIGGGTQAIADALPKYITNAAQAVGISLESLISDVGASADPNSMAESICVSLESTFIVPAVKIVTFFVMFAIVSSVLSIGVSVVNSIFKLPIIRSFNKLFGGIIGAVKGFIAAGIASVAFNILSFIMSGNEISQAINESNIQQFVWEIINSSF